MSAIQEPAGAARLTGQAPPERRQGRRRWLGGLERPLRRVLPRSLLGRSLLIVLIPLVVTQGVSLQLFYGSHLDIVSRRLSTSVAGEVSQTLLLLDRYRRPADQAWIMATASDQYQLAMRLRPRATLERPKLFNIIGPMDEELSAALQVIRRPFTMDWHSDPHVVKIHVQLQGGVLDIDAPRKRLDVGPIYLFVAWNAGSALLLFLVAALFMRIQVRAIRRLARAAEAFGMGQEQGTIRPEGAQEVRKAASAFNRMQERILRFVAQRTAMLAGVSHDLRTPLTRLRLSLAMVPQHGALHAEELAPEISEMIADVEEMERMIEGYLGFARGEGSEQSRLIDLPALLDEVALSASRAGALFVRVLSTPMPELMLRPMAIRRVLANLLDNARRHGGRISLVAMLEERAVQIVVDDDGPGIPGDRRETVFRPFESGATGGTGLGLTIARDIVRAHGGELSLENSPMGGLRARIRLPLQNSL
ncbi:ATP-binding protein [Lichenicoccus sp.]|uniref:ATP-binding protein n=1 Tax=Lichenicoccus sp. TaxID=2781899 RepID=UPI003D0CC1B8